MDDKKEDKLLSQRVTIGFYWLLAVVLSIHSFGAWSHSRWTFWTLLNVVLAALFWRLVHSAKQQFAEAERMVLLEEDIRRKFKLLDYERKDINPNFIPYRFEDLEKFAAGEITRSELLEIILNNVKTGTYIDKLPCHTCQHHSKDASIRCTVNPEGSALNCQRFEPVAESSGETTPINSVRAPFQKGGICNSNNG